MDKQKIVGICRDDLPQEKQCSGGGVFPSVPHLGPEGYLFFSETCLNFVSRVWPPALRIP